MNELDRLGQVSNANLVPITVHMDVTYRCDLACVHCYLLDRIKKEMSLEEITRTFDQMAEAGSLFLQISGGDLFLRPDALDILRAAAERRFFIVVVTHAGHITQEVAKEMAALGIARVHISVYSSNPPTHDAITKLPGSLMRTMRGVQNLRNVGIPVVLQCTVMEGNERALLEMPLLAAKYDCDYAMEHTVFGGRSTGFAATDDTGCSIDLRTLNMADDGKADVIRFNKGLELANIGYKKPEHHPCSAGRSYVYIDPEGVVFPCIQWEQAAGSIRERSFGEIWQDADIFQRARNLKRGDFSGCTSCENFSFCELCPGQAFRETGDASGSAPSRCRDSEATRYALTGSYSK